MFERQGNIRRGVLQSVCVLAAFLWIANLAVAQFPTGTILGVVKDATGAVIPGVSVTVTNADTGLVRSGTTGVDGSYRFPALPVGTYEIRAEHPGFQRELQSGLKLNIGQEAVINMSLQVGAVEQTVAVTAEAPMIETTSANVSGLVAENEVRDLPLNARNLIELGTLFPGVTISKTGGQGVPNGFATKLTIMGTRYNTSLFQLDGADINDNTGSAGSAAGILMGVETVREFNVITSGFSAEYGRHSGGVFNAVTKSGTNTIHGSVFEFLRNDQIDAARWEENAFNEGEKAEYKRNQYGFALGGPIVHDRTFYFGSYESLRDREGQLQNYNVPNEALRSSGILPRLTAAQCTNTTNNGTVLPDGRCMIPINSIIRPYLDAWPHANGEDLGDGRARYIRTLTFPTDEHFFTGKVDHRFSDNDSIFGRYTYDGAKKHTGSGIAWIEANRTRTQYATLSHTRLMTPQVINVLLLGYNRSRISTHHEQIEGTTAFPLRSFTAHEEPVGSISTGAPALSGLGGGGFIPTVAMLNSYQVKNDVFYTRTVHSFKFGGNFQRMQFLRRTFFNGGGSFTFNTLPEFLQGSVRNYVGMMPDSEPMVYPRQSLLGLYVQDDWRVSSQLTLNLGLRYEITSTPHVLNDRYSNLHEYLTPGKSFPQDFVIGNPPWLNPSLKNVAPRVGFAWDPTGSGKTSVRGGAGIFHDQVLVGPYIFSFVSTPPFFRNAELDVRVGGVRPIFPTAASVQQDLLGGRPQTEPLQYKLDQPTVYKWSLDLQRAVTPSTSVEMGYSGTRGVHLMRVILTNASIAQEGGGRLFVPVGAPVMFPNIGRVRPKQSDGVSHYHAFRLQVNQRFARGLQVRGAYTFSKAIDDGSNFAGSADFGNSPSGSRYLGMKDYGLAAFDIRNALTVNFTYDLPGQNLSGVAGKILGGWQTSGIVTVQDGSPTNVDTGFTPTHWSTIGAYPDLVPGAKVKYDARNPDGYFDVSAFAMPGQVDPASQFPADGSTQAPANPGYIGNLGRSFLIGPGVYTANFVLAKRIALRENVSLQFRSEFFNLFNRPNFNDPDTTIFVQNTRRLNTEVGRITETTGTPRQIQLGLKLEF